MRRGSELLGLVQKRDDGALGSRFCTEMRGWWVSCSLPLHCMTAIASCRGAASWKMQVTVLTPETDSHRQTYRLFHTAKQCSLALWVLSSQIYDDDSTLKGQSALSHWWYSWFSCCSWCLLKAVTLIVWSGTLCHLGNNLCFYSRGTLAMLSTSRKNTLQEWIPFLGVTDCLSYKWCSLWSTVLM